MADPKLVLCRIHTSCRYLPADILVIYSSYSSNKIIYRGDISRFRNYKRLGQNLWMESSLLSAKYLQALPESPANSGTCWRRFLPGSAPLTSRYTPSQRPPLPFYATQGKFHRLCRDVLLAISRTDMQHWDRLFYRKPQMISFDFPPRNVLRYQYFRTYHGHMPTQSVRVCSKVLHSWLYIQVLVMVNVC